MKLFDIVSFIRNQQKYVSLSDSTLVEMITGKQCPQSHPVRATLLCTSRSVNNRQLLRATIEV